MNDSKEEENLRRNIMTISEVIECMPSVLKSNFADLFILMGKVSENKNISDLTTREMGFDIITSLIEKKKSLFTKDIEKFNVFLQSLFKYSLEMDDEVDENWITPKSCSYVDEAFVPEEQLEATFSQIDRLIDCLGFDKVINSLNVIVIELINRTQGGWKFKYVGFMTISQIIEYVKDISTIENLIEIILANIENEHPKIRYACMQCIEQISEHLEPNFQNNYHKIIFPKLIGRFSDECLRNQLQSLESLQAFIEHCHSEKIFKNTDYLRVILDSLMTLFIQENIPISLRESIINVCSELTSVADEFMKPFAEKCLLIMFNFFSKVYNDNNFKSVYGALIELITVLGPKCTDAYIKSIPDVVLALITIQNKIPQSTDPLFENLKAAWSELIPLIKENYPMLLKDIFESIMILINNTPKVYLQKAQVNSEEINQIDVMQLLKEDNSELKINKTKTENISTSETSDYAGAIELLNTMIDKFGSLFTPFANIAEQAVIPLLSFETNSQIRMESSNTLFEIANMISTTINKSNLNEMENYIAISKRYIVLLFNALEKEGHNEAITVLLDNMGKIIDLTNCAFFTPDELNELCLKLLTIFEKVERFRLSTIEKKKLVESENMKDKQNFEAGSDDEEECEEDDFADELQKDIEDIEDVLVSIADVFGYIFKTHKESTIGIVHKLKNDLLIKYFTKESSNFEKRMGVFIIDDMAEYLGQKLIPDLWPDIINIILAYINDKDHSLRQACAYGIGEIAKNTLQDTSIIKGNYDLSTFSDKYGELFFESIVNSLKLNKKDEENEEEWGYAKDNFTVAVSKVLQFQSEKINIEKWVNLYLENLPIMYDEDEAIEQHELFMKLLMTNERLILGTNASNLHKVLLILAEIYQTKFVNEEIDSQIFSLFSSIKNNESYASQIILSKEICKNIKIMKKLTNLLG